MISIIIVNYNTERFLERCIESVYKNVLCEFELIIVDNNSRDKEILKEIKGRYKSTKLIMNRRNLGFARANNQAISIAKGKYILTLNPDVLLTRDYVPSLIKEIEDKPSVGAATGKLLNMRNPRIIDSTGHIIHSNRLASNRGFGKLDKEQYNSGYVFGVCAAAALYRKDMLEDIRIGNEYFDNDFFAYLEDVDLDWRARLFGWKAYYTDQASAYHHRESSTSHFYRMKQAVRNRFLMIVKNDSSLQLLLNLPFALIYPGLFFKMLKKRKSLNKKIRTNKKKLKHWFKPYPYSRLLKRILH
jgi:GT2 family glycosyltransferase